MASAYNKEKIKDILTCSVCSQIFSGPKLLPCYHTFCENCIKDLPKTKTGEKEGILCPLCTSFTDDTNHKIHHMVEEFVQLYLNINNSDKPCSLCEHENNRAKWHCIETCCRIDLCDNCKRTHLKTPLSKNHRVVPSEDGSVFLVNQPVKCSKHDEQDTHFYCETCNILICIVCKGSSHGSHLTTDLDDIEKQLKQEVQKKLVIISDNIGEFETEILQNDEVLQELEKENQEIIKQLEERKKLFIAKIETQLAREKKFLHDRKSEIGKEVAQLKTRYESQIKENKTLIKFTKATIENSRSSKFVQEMINGLRDKVTERTKKSVEKNDQIQSHKMTMKPNQVLEDCDKLLGTIEQADKPYSKADAKKSKVSNGIGNFVKLSVFMLLVAVLYAVLQPTQKTPFTGKTLPSQMTTFTPKTLPSKNTTFTHETQPSQKTTFNQNPRIIEKNITEVLMTITKSKGNAIADHIPYDGYMAFINNTLWLPSWSDDTIKVITIEQEKLPPINFRDHNYRGPRAVIQVQENEVILASDRGLFSLNITGHIQYKLSDGEFTDISHDENHLVAIERNTHNIQIYSYEGNKWKHNTTFKCAHLKHWFNNRLILKGKTIYLSSWYEDIIQRYNLEKKMLSQTYGHHGRDKPGQLYYPKISLTDKYGSVLVCDYMNHRLQVLTADGQWLVFTLDSITYPMDVVVDEKHLYLLSNIIGQSSRSITQYNI